MLALLKRPAVLVSLVVIASLAVPVASASAGQPSGKAPRHKCGKKAKPKVKKKCRKRPRVGLGTPENPQPGDLIVKSASSLSVGTSPTTLLTLPSNANVPAEFHASILLANQDQTHGRMVDCNLMSGGASFGHAATTLPPTHADQPLQFATLQVYGSKSALGGSLVCTSRGGATVVGEVRLAVLVLGGLFVES